jgi:hypothetical protein
MGGRVREEDKIRIEVFVTSTMEASICVNDQWVVGDQLHAVA